MATTVGVAVGTWIPVRPLLALLDHATQAGWTVRAACPVLELGETRAWRWLARQAAERLDDLAPGGHPDHGLLDDEVAEIVWLFHQWGETDRSHRKQPAPGSTRRTRGGGSRPPSTARSCWWP